MLTLLAMAVAAPVTTQGPVMQVDGRVFVQGPRSASQKAGPSVSLATRPLFAHTSDSGLWTVRVEPFLRLDSADSRRSHFDLRQAQAEVTQNKVGMAFGIGQFRWGSLQGFSPIDVLNQIDLVEDLSGRERLGRPYVGLSWSSSQIEIRTWILPYHRARTFPGRAGRLRPLSGVDASGPQYQSVFGRFHPSFAGRLTLYAGPLDLNLSGYSGLANDPRFVAQFTEQAVATAYDQLQQVSLDSTAVVGPLLVKAESAVRWWGVEGRPSFVVAGGLELTRLGVFGTRMDAVVLLEHVYDDRPVGAPLTTMDNDTFAGLRIALNDRGGTAFLVGGLLDVETGFLSSRVELGRRVGEHFRVSGEATVFTGTETAAEWWLAGEDYGQLRVEYFL